MIEKVNLHEALAAFEEPWSPRIVGDLNDIQIEVVKLLGEFVWHHHDGVAEAFIVLNGSLRVRFRDHDVDLGPGELIVIPPNVEHMPMSEGGCEVILLEPRSTVNTGNVMSERTVPQPERWRATR
jgi:mannose-6-phosphate isomerase-like protein (cupin superfamily)